MKYIYLETRSHRVNKSFIIIMLDEQRIQMDRLSEMQTDIWAKKNNLMNGQMDKQSYGQTDRQTNRQFDKQMDGQAD